MLGSCIVWKIQVFTDIYVQVSHDSNKWFPSRNFLSYNLNISEVVNIGLPTVDKDARSTDVKLHLIVPFPRINFGVIKQRRSKCEYHNCGYTKHYSANPWGS